MSTMTLEPCPFCGNGMISDDEEGCYQKAGFIGAQTPVWSVTCFSTSCNASVEATSKEAAIKAWNRRAQPAQAVDVGAVRRVIDELNGYCEASDDSCYGTLATSLVRGYTEQLVRALTGEKAGRVDDVVSVAALRTLIRGNGGWASCFNDEIFVMWNDIEALLPASPAPDKEGL